jgi:Ser-tRNA(Ala) deacylase AlaX
VSTKLLYMDEFGVTQCMATVQIVAPHEQGVDVVLDQTCFYPRGGGQDWDTGTITVGDTKMQVSEVRLDEDGVAHHIGIMMAGELQPDSKADCGVDAERREANSRLHSAGHLLDMAAEQLGYDWEPSRGAHYAHMSFVEYRPEEGFVLDESLKPQIQAKIDELASRTYANKILFMPASEMCYMPMISAFPAAVRMCGASVRSVRLPFLKLLSKKGSSKFLIK